eukprot:scaffold1388_cov390-Prasinococcus_capsulatus_cf.AAC.22
MSATATCHQLASSVLDDCADHRFLTPGLSREAMSNGCLQGAVEPTRANVGKDKICKQADSETRSSKHDSGPCRSLDEPAQDTQEAPNQTDKPATNAAGESPSRGPAASLAPSEPSWRCINLSTWNLVRSTHSTLPKRCAQCLTPFACCDDTLCTAHAGFACKCQKPPAVEKEKDYQLIGDPGLKNGEKKLRSQIIMSREWASDATRLALVQKYGEVNGMESFVTAVRNKDVPGLRKPHLLQLAREWHFMSDIWQPKRKREGIDNHKTSAPRCYRRKDELAAAKSKLAKNRAQGPLQRNDNHAKVTGSNGTAKRAKGKRKTREFTPRQGNGLTGATRGSKSKKPGRKTNMPGLATVPADIHLESLARFHEEIAGALSDPTNRQSLDFPLELLSNTAAHPEAPVDLAVSGEPRNLTQSWLASNGETDDSKGAVAGQGASFLHGAGSTSELVRFLESLRPSIEAMWAEQHAHRANRNIHSTLSSIDLVAGKARESLDSATSATLLNCSQVILTVRAALLTQIPVPVDKVRYCDAPTMHLANCRDNLLEC